MSIRQFGGGIVGGFFYLVCKSKYISEFLQYKMPAICQIIHAINFDFCNYMCQVLWLLEIPKIANAESLSWRKPQPNIGDEEGNT